MVSKTLYDNKKQRESEFPKKVMDLTNSLMALQREIKAQLPYSRSEKTPPSVYVERIAPYFEKLYAAYKLAFNRLPQDLQVERAEVFGQIDMTFYNGMESLAKDDSMPMEAKMQLLNDMVVLYDAFEAMIPENGEVSIEHVKAADTLLERINEARLTIANLPAETIKNLDSYLLVTAADMQNEMRASNGPGSGR